MLVTTITIVSLICLSHLPGQVKTTKSVASNRSNQANKWNASNREMKLVAFIKNYERTTVAKLSEALERRKIPHYFVGSRGTGLYVEAAFAQSARKFLSSFIKRHPGVQSIEGNVNDKKTMVSIALIKGDLALGASIMELLEAAGIPCLVEGSKAYGVSVLPKDEKRAGLILRVDSRNRDYWISFD